MTRSQITATEQLVFELPHRVAMGLEDFLVSESNAEAVAMIDRWPNWPVGAAVIVGPQGSGKTHLANVWMTRTKARMLDAARISRDDVPIVVNQGAAVIENLPHAADEAALFHLLNLVREARLQLLFTSETAPGDLDVRLPDLSSRLKALPVASIEAPDDALLRAVLVKLFADRQLSVEPNVIDYVLVRMERSMAAAERFVRESDHQALVRQRGVTRSVAASALDALGY